MFGTVLPTRQSHPAYRGHHIQTTTGGHCMAVLMSPTKCAASHRPGVTGSRRYHYITGLPLHNKEHSII
eukprot:6425006-Pyramimonas_sp.AAC.1